MSNKIQVSTPIDQAKILPIQTAPKQLTPKSKSRDCLISNHADQLDHASLLAVILGKSYGSEHDAVYLGQRVLKHLGNLSKLSTTNSEQLLAIKGIGPAKACRLLAVAEIVRQVVTLNNKKLKNNTAPNNLNYLQILSHQVRCSSPNTQPLLIACQINPKLKDDNRSLQSAEYLMEALQESLEFSITLSLSSTLSDYEQHARWLAKLLLSETSQTGISWTIISYRNDEIQSQHEVDHASRLLELAKTLGLNVNEVIIISSDDQWSINASKGKSEDC